MDGRKDDAGKPRPSLVLDSMARAIARVVDVAEYGARKYAPDNWLQVPDGIKRYTDAGLRHQQAHALGEVNDPESGLPHLAHAAWCVLAVLELQERQEMQEALGVSVPARAADEQEKINAAMRELLGERVQAGHSGAASRSVWRELSPYLPCNSFRRMVDAAEGAELTEVVRQLRKCPDARTAMDLHGLRVHRVGMGVRCTAPDGAELFTGLGPIKGWAKAGRRALRAYAEARLGTANEELRQFVLINVKDPRAYLTALREGLLWVERRTPGIISIRDRSKQKLREIHGVDLADAWKRLRQMPDVDRLMHQITARFLATGGTRLRPATPKRVDGTEIGGPENLGGVGGPLRTSYVGEVRQVAAAAELDAQLEELTKAHPDRRFEQARRARKLTVRKDRFGGVISVILLNVRSAGMTVTTAFAELANSRFIDALLTEALKGVDHAVAYWQDQLRKDPICADGLMDGWLTVRREGRAIRVRVDRSRFVPLLAPLDTYVAYHRSPAALLAWVHNVRPRTP